uniref:Transcription and mRNA export factor ENY2 n=1 Tax=Pelagomonas calceolata TaxID=35677 RepID=A0A7S4E6Y5_9STRA|mmetsp:Transcript_12283/g.37793  ORF Transcript_12283/g.37793 Transcript_12283/m.37793 type:complete len:154 (+) Transcript_12283:76-537(+)
MSDAGAQERKQKDDAVRTTIMQKLVETGEKERLKELLRQKLIECGWRDELKEYCKEVIRSKGLEKITVDELVAEITPRGRGAFLVCRATRDARPRSDGARRGQNGTSTEHPKIPPGASTDVRLRYLRCHRPRRQGAFCQSILQRARPGEPRRF